MFLEALTRRQNFLIGIARIFDFQGSMLDVAYKRLYQPLRGPVDALEADMKQLGADFRRAIEHEQEKR
jgi:hypothetical protein